MRRVSTARPLLVLAATLAIGAMLGGCTKCGPFWDDWSPRACRSGPP